jgi:maltose alpha-D-glucosyltransferase/alpha-amylase
MVHSLHFVADRGLFRHVERGGSPVEKSELLEPWGQYWSLWVSSAFLRAYLRTTEGASFLPPGRTDLGGLLFVYLLEKAIQELGRALAGPPDTLRLPLRAINRLVETAR